MLANVQSIQASTMQNHSTKPPKSKEPPIPLDLAALAATFLLDDTQAAAILGISAGTLSVWRSVGRYALPYVKIGRRVKYRAGDLREFIEKRMRLHTGEGAK